MQVNLWGVCVRPIDRNGKEVASLEPGEWELGKCNSVWIMFLALELAVPIPLSSNPRHTRPGLPMGLLAQSGM